MDGWITIGTKLDTKELEKQLKRQKAELNKYAKEEEKLLSQKSKVETELQPYEKEIENAGKAYEADMKLAATDEQRVEIMKQYDLELSEIDAKYSKQLTKQEEIEQALKSNLNAQKRITSEVAETEAELKKSKGYDNLKKTVESIGKSTENTMKKISKWALALVGIRSIYSGIRSVMSTLSQYDDQMAADIEYMRYALASSLKPLIEWLIQAAFKLMSYVNMIAKAWLGVDLFANATAESMKKTGKEAKNLGKTLLGFDDLNILGGGEDTSAGAGAVAPSLDLSATDDVKPPGWLQWIMDNNETILAIFSGITLALISLKMKGINPIMALGIGTILTGVIMLIQNIINFIKDPTWENFAKILDGLAVILAGVAIAMLAVNAANPVAWIIAAIAAVVALASAVIKNWDTIKAVIGKVASWVNEKLIQPVKGFFAGLWDGIVKGVNAAINGIKSAFNSVVNFFKNIISTIVDLFKKIGTTVGNVLGSAFKAVINGILSAIENILNFPIKSINKLLDVINAVPGINLKKLSTFNLPRLATGGIVDVPRTGVNIGGAIAGEAGAEGVLPLTNAETMSRLGQEIGKWITLNFNITNELDGRILNRRLVQLNNQNTFGKNGG